MVVFNADDFYVFALAVHVTYTYNKILLQQSQIAIFLKLTVNINHVTVLLSTLWMFLILKNNNNIFIDRLNSSTKAYIHITHQQHTNKQKNIKKIMFYGKGTGS